MKTLFKYFVMVALAVGVVICLIVILNEYVK